MKESVRRLELWDRPPECLSIIHQEVPQLVLFPCPGSSRSKAPNNRFRIRACGVILIQSMGEATIATMHQQDAPQVSIKAPPQRCSTRRFQATNNRAARATRIYHRCSRQASSLLSARRLAHRSRSNTFQLWSRVDPISPSWSKSSNIVISSTSHSFRTWPRRMYSFERLRVR